MRHTITALAAAGFAIAAQAFPPVSNDPDVQLNQWTYRVSAAKAKAKALNRPILIAFGNIGVCSYTTKWDNNIVSNGDGKWNAFLADNPMILVAVDQQHMSDGTYSSPNFNSLIAGNGTWSTITAYPEMVLLNPDGTLADQFIARNTLGANPAFYTRVQATTSRYPATPATAAGTIGFSAAALSALENAGSISVTVTRQFGGSGAQTFQYATQNGTALAGVNYTATSGTLSWADGDTSSKTLTVPLINDAVWSAPSSRSFTLALTKASGGATLGASTVTVTVSEDDPAPVAFPAFVSPTPGAGAVVSVSLSAAASVPTHADSTATVTYSATGLPPGLAIGSGSGLISGTPTAAGDYPVTVTASNSQGSVSTGFTIRVSAAALQKPVGRFSGFLYEGDERTVLGSAKFTAAATGKVTTKIVRGSASYSFTSTWDADTTGGAYTTRATSRAGQTLELAVDAAGFVTGTFDGLAIAGSLVDTARMPLFASYYTAVLGATEVTPYSLEIDNAPQGYGYLTFTLSASGTAKYAGVLADSTPVSGTADVGIYSGDELAALGYAGAVPGQSYAGFPVYQALYSRRGAIAGMIWVDAQDPTSVCDNLVFIGGSAWTYPGRSASLPDDGFTATFDDLADSPIGAYYEQSQNLAATFDGATFSAGGEDLAVLAAGSSIALEAGNALAANLRPNIGTGVISGTMVVPTLDGASVTRVTYKGVLVPLLGEGGGFYLLSDPAASGYRLKRSQSVTVLP